MSTANPKAFFIYSIPQYQMFGISYLAIIYMKSNLSILRQLFTLNFAPVRLI